MIHNVIPGIPHMASIHTKTYLVFPFHPIQYTLFQFSKHLPTSLPFPAIVSSNTIVRISGTWSH